MFKKYYLYLSVISFMFLIVFGVGVKQSSAVLNIEIEENGNGQTLQIKGVQANPINSTDDIKDIKTVEPVSIDNIKAVKVVPDSASVDIEINKATPVHMDLQDQEDIDNNKAVQVPSNSDSYKIIEFKEITVTGSELRAKVQTGKAEIRGWDAEKKEVTISMNNINTSDDLADYTKALTVSDKNITNIKLSDKTVKLDYQQPAKLFGFIPVKLTVQAEVDNNDQVKLKFPWYKFLTKNNAKELKKEVAKLDLTKDSLNTSGEDGQLANIDLQSALQRQQQTLQTLSNVMKSVHDLTMGIIKKIN